MNTIMKEPLVPPAERDDHRKGQEIWRSRISTTLNRMVTKIEPSSGPYGAGCCFLLLQTAATDCTGITNYISAMTARHGTNIQENAGRRFGNNKHGSTYLISGKPDCIQSLIQEIDDRRDDTIEGVRIHNANLYDLKIIIQDDIGLLQGISGILNSHQINIRDQEVIICTPPWKSIGWPDRDGADEFHSMASIVLRIEVPPEAERQILHIIDEIRHLDQQKDWDIRCGPIRTI